MAPSGVAVAPHRRVSAQGPPPQRPDGAEDDPRPEQPHPLDEPDDAPQPTDPGTDQQVGA